MENEEAMWYCVHALHYFEYKDGDQKDYLFWEHMYLIRATSPDEAMEKGELKAKKVENYTEGSGLKLNERPARLRFASIRKVVECQDLDEQTELPTDGTELSYSEYIVSDPDNFDKLIKARTSSVDYVGDENDEEKH